MPKPIREYFGVTVAPMALKTVFGMDLTYDRLNSEIIEQANLGYLPKDARRAVRKFAKRHFRLVPQAIAIPAGIPLDWLLALPIDRRTKSAVKTVFFNRGRRSQLETPLTVAEFVKIRQVGVMTFVELLCVVESAELNRPSDVADGGSPTNPKPAEAGISESNPQPIPDTPPDQSRERVVQTSVILSGGTKYGPPSTAVPWGEKGCPVVPKPIREHFGQHSVPMQPSVVFGTHLNYDDLDSGFMERKGLESLTSRARSALHWVVNRHSRFMSKQTAIPKGIMMDWLVALPISDRTRIAVERIFRDLGEPDQIESAVNVSEFLEIGRVGTAALVDLLCVMESAVSETPKIVKSGRISRKIKRTHSQTGVGDPKRTVSTRPDSLHSQVFQARVFRSNGVKYGPPPTAKRWGNLGCPVIPKSFREQYRDTRIPKELRTVLGRRSTFAKLDSKIIEQRGLGSLPNSTRRAVQDVVNKLSFATTNVTVIPAGAPLNWLVALPVEDRTRKAIETIFGTRGERNAFENPVLASELLKLKHVGIMTLIDLLCVIESVEFGESDQANTPELAPDKPIADPDNPECVSKVTPEPKSDAMVNRDVQPVLVTSEGIAFGPASTAKPWGSRGCPVIPKPLRQHFGDTDVPEEIRHVFGMSSTYEQLDSEIFERANLDNLTAGMRDAVRKIVSSEPDVLSQEIAIPAGMPLEWLVALPIGGRTRNSVEIAFRNRNRADHLETPLLISEFLKVRHAGVATLIDLLCVMESAELPMPSGLIGEGLERRTRSIEHEAFAWDLEQMNQSRMSSLSPILEQMTKFASWAQAETDATTFAEGVLEVLSGSDTRQEWSSFVRTPFANLSPRPPHPYVLIEAWANNLPDLEREVFEHRLGSKDRQTLEDLGQKFDLTRERIRQIESKVKRKFQAYLSTDDAEPMRWRAETVRSRIGVAAPRRVVESLVVAPHNAKDYGDVLLFFAGPYVIDGDWLIGKDLRGIDVRKNIVSHADEFGRLDRIIVRGELASAGLDPSFHSEWLTREPAIREFNGALVVWGRSAKDRLVFALADLGRQATIEELLGHLRENISRGYALNALGADDRVVRVDRSRYALKSWGINEYKGIAEAIRRLIVETAQPVNIDDACVRIAQRFHVSEGSVRWYTEAPMFVIEGPCVRLRCEDEPYRFDYKPVRETRGVFVLGPQRVSIVLTVDTDMLRGSGRMLPNAAGGILGIEVNDDIEFTSDEGETIALTYPETSIVGPSMGSMRVFAERLAADKGDHLTLIMDRSRNSVEARLTRSTATADGWGFVAHLTGLDTDSGMERLAESLHGARGEIRAILRQRGDNTVLSALPQRPTSPKLAEALGELRNQISRDSENRE